MNHTNIHNEVNKAFPVLHKGMNKGYEYTRQYNPELADLIRQMFLIFMKPLTALRAKLYRIFLKPFKKVENSRIPVFRLLVIGIGFFLFSQKDISFSVNMSNSGSMITQSSETEIFDLNKEDGLSMIEDDDDVPKAVGTSLSQPSDYAPVNVKQLEDRYSPKEYINRFKGVAISEMKKFGIPASITLAQGLVESRAGNSKLAVQNNNHFGIKCFSKKCGKGHCTNHFDDNHKDFFRKYDSVWESFRDHSKILQKDRYKKLKKHGRDYKKWAKGLKQAGYATDKRYDKKLIATIQKYKLYEYDK